MSVFKKIFTRILMSFIALTIHVENDAIPFNPLTDAPDVDTTSYISDRPVGGLGIHIIKKMVDDIQYQRINEKNQITTVKEI